MPRKGYEIPIVIMLKDCAKFLELNSIVTIDCNGPFLIFRCTYNCHHFESNLFDKFSINFPEMLENAAVKRKAEFLAGRLMARCALENLYGKSCQILTGRHRAPIWPEEVVGSISHTDNSACCAVALKTDVPYLGIDKEDWIPSLIIKDISDNIINEREKLLLRRLSLDFEKAFTLTFSAKECLFKALYPSIGYYFDFDSAEIVSLSLEDNSFELILTKTLAADYPRGRKFIGYFVVDSEGSLCWLSG